MSLFNEIDTCKAAGNLDTEQSSKKSHPVGNPALDSRAQTQPVLDINS